jgi:hypothetical protein
MIDFVIDIRQVGVVLTLPVPAVDHHPSAREDADEDQTEDEVGAGCTVHLAPEGHDLDWLVVNSLSGF